MSPNNGEIHNPNRNLAIPDWVNAEYFSRVLKDDEPDYVRVAKFTATAATPPGENFTSVMVRVHMQLEMKDGSVKSKTYVLKTMLSEGQGSGLITELCLFPKEMEMYNRYLPAFEELYRAAGRKVHLAPKCLLVETRGDRINFVFEDLKIKNFENANRREGLDMNHMRPVLQRLAEFHAASAVYAERNGPYPKNFDFGFVKPSDDLTVQKSNYEFSAKVYKQAMLQWGLKDADKFIRKFPTFDQYWKCAMRTLDSTDNTFNVLTHGDFWSSNIMFKYAAGGELDDLMFLDYQLCKWGSPAEDLMFFITISADKDIRIMEFEHLVEIYHTHLIECLQELKYEKPLPKLRDLHMDMYRENSSFYAFFAILNHLPIVLLPTDKDSNLGMMSRLDEQGEKFRMRMLTNPPFVEAVKKIFPFYHNRGVFNFEDFE